MSLIAGRPRGLLSTPQGAVLAVVGVSVFTSTAVLALFAQHSTLWTVLCCGLTLLALSAAWCTVCAARAADGRQRAAWTCQTVGLLGWAFGAGISAGYEAGSPIPAVAHIGYVLFWVATCAALILIPVARVDSSRTRLVLDAVIVGAAMFEIAWLMVLHVTIGADRANRLTELVSLTYLSATTVIVTVAILLVVRARGRRRKVLFILTVAIVAMAVTRTLFIYLTVAGDPANAARSAIGWAIGIFIIGVAALRDGPPAEPEIIVIPSRISLWLPYVPVIVAALVATSKLGVLPELAPVFLASIVMVGGVLARQLLVLRDNRRLLVKIAEQSLRDPLTGLANRVLFHDRLTHAVQLHQRDRSPVTVLVLDLDNFKLVNDAMGHPVGDELLVSAAERLLRCVRTGDTVARLGGDEFAVVMEGSEDDARYVANRLVQAFCAPFDLGGQDVLIRASIGSAVARAGDGDVSADVLLRQADAAMYAAKRAGTGGLHTFSPDIHTIDGGPPVSEGGWPEGTVPTAAAAVRLLGELRQAIDKGDLALVYQPKFDLHTAGIVGVEALVRWPNPRLGMLEPDQFLPLVRQHGLMGPVTDLVLAKALDDIADWEARGIATPVAVNLFAPSLADLELPAKLARALAQRGLTADWLTVEITEDLFLDDLGRTRAVLGELRELGIRIAIDDFGSGYSALAYLRELPIDEMKIDRLLVEPIVDDPRAEAVVRAVVELAHVLGATVVAEGVEDAATAALLRGIGCDIAQGYYFGRPIGVESTTALLGLQVQPESRPGQLVGTSVSEIELMQ